VLGTVSKIWSHRSHIHGLRHEPPRLSFILSFGSSGRSFTFLQIDIATTVCHLEQCLPPPGHCGQRVALSYSARSIYKGNFPVQLLVTAAATFIMYRTLVFAASLLSLARGQLVGTEQTETHPGMTWQSCTAKGSCTSKSGKIVIDANWRWLHVKGGYVLGRNTMSSQGIDGVTDTPTAILAMNGTPPLAQTTSLVQPTVLSTVRTIRGRSYSSL
jgi:hypothetical protein